MSSRPLQWVVPTIIFAAVVVATQFSATASTAPASPQSFIGPSANSNAGIADTALFPFLDSSGVVLTDGTEGRLDPHNPFFVSLGTNGRACVTCHRPDEGWSVTPEGVQLRFLLTNGTDPIFRTNDGSNSPNAPVATLEQRRKAYNMLLTKGLIRIGLPIPAGAEFTLVAVDDPYHYASASELSLFRRPLPAANLPFLTTVMWDGRESPKGQSLTADLTSQATDATTGHAQATNPPTPAQLQAIVDLETHLYTAQIFDFQVGDLDGNTGGLGGPFNLAATPFYVGINDVLGGDPTGAPFNPNAMTLYQAWAHPTFGSRDVVEDRESVARGEALFDSKPIAITDVAGLNDALGQPVIMGTCTTCHDTPNVGNHSVALPINIGIADASRRTPDMPLYTLQNNTTGDIVQTTDPGRALITGKWADIGKFKGPILRGLAARAPYFHNGSAASLGDVVDFYNTRFGIGFTPKEKQDLVNFLRTL